MPESKGSKFAPISQKHHQQSLDRLVYKVGQCIDYQSLYALEEDFNRVGLTVQTTSRNRMILCKLVNGGPITEKVIDDYIYIGSLDDLSRELTDRSSEKICDFIRTNAGTPGKVENISRVWRNGLRMYQSAIAIANEDIDRISGELLNE
jgi:hypothetical protein